MKLVKWVLRVAVVGFFLSLLSTLATDSVPVKANTQNVSKKTYSGLIGWVATGVFWIITRTVRLFWRVETTREVDPMENWDWPEFEEAVTTHELEELYDGFLARCLQGLRGLIRHGQADFGIKNPETVAEHVEDLEKLAEKYGEKRELSARATIILKVMARSHECAELMTQDLPQFPLPSDAVARRKYIKDWTPPTRRQEKKRWLKEWQEERPFFITVIIGLPSHEQRILLYIFDRVYLGQDALADLFRNLHYLQPALSIRRKTRKTDARKMHFDRAREAIGDREVRDELFKAYRVPKASKSVVG